MPRELIPLLIVFLIVGVIGYLILSDAYGKRLTAKATYNTKESCNSQAIDFASTENFQRSVEWSLWTFRSDAWNGYIDFQGGGRYWTHWGYGRWWVDEAGTIQMQNDYDEFAHTFVIDPSGREYSGTRSDGLQVTGDLLCGKYALKDFGQPRDKSPAETEAEEAITGFYRELLGREPDPAGLDYWVGLRLRGASYENIRQGFLSSAEYRGKMRTEDRTSGEFEPIFESGPQTTR